MGEKMQEQGQPEMRTLYFRPDIHKRIKDIADKSGRKLQAVAEEMAMAYLKRKEKAR